RAAVEFELEPVALIPVERARVIGHHDRAVEQALGVAAQGHPQVTVQPPRQAALDRPPARHIYVGLISAQAFGLLIAHAELDSPAAPAMLDPHGGSALLPH